jgi:glycine/D-amino acid oxidase-like deaminating enzyme
MHVDTATPHHWRKICREPAADTPPLDGEREVDLAVIGGGFTGLSAALAAATAGIDTLVLEGEYVGAGASGRNNGMVVPQHSSASPGAIERVLGKTFGPRYNALVAGAARSLFELAAKHGIDADGVQKGWIQPAHSEATLARARTIHAEWKAFGAAVEWLDAGALVQRLGAPGYLGAWQAEEGGHINPYALAQGVARAALRAGARIHAQAPVHAIRPDGTRWLIEAAGGIVRANRLLIATNALTGAFWPGLAKAMVPVKLFQTASRPLSDNLRATILAGNQGFSDMRREIRAFHYDRDGRLISGGRMMLWHHAAARGRGAASRGLQQSFPALGDIAVEEYWEGIVAVSPDRLPRLMRLASGVLFCGAYSGRGVALGMALGRCVGEFLAGRLAEADLPLPVSGLRTIPAHGIQVVGARLIQPWHRLLDRRG